MKARRLVPYYRAVCNGGSLMTGCDWAHEDGRKAVARKAAEDHAIMYAHEVVVTNANDGLVLDGRVK